MKINLRLSISLLVIVLFFAGCKKPTDNIDVIINTTSLFKAPILVHFSNANSAGSVVGSFPVTISGKDAALVQMGTGGTNFNVTAGYLPLAFRSLAKPSTTTPLTFNISAQIPGWAPITKTIVVTNEGTLVYEVAVVELSRPATGTTAMISQSTLAAGATSSPVVLEASTSVSVPEKSSLAIPTGTQMLDASKNSITASDLKSTIIQYASATSTSSKLFPGGLNPNNVLDNSNNPIVGGVNFVNVGLLTINMTAGGTAVKNFSKPIAISQELRDGIVNFNTGQALKSGETIPLWSLNEETGQWKAEGNATVTTSSNGKLVANYNITHLSSWALNFVYAASIGSLVRNLEINLTPSIKPWLGEYNIHMESADGTFIAGINNYKPEIEFFKQGVLANGNVSYVTVKDKYGFSMPFVPNISSAKIVVYNANNAKIAESAVFNPSSATSVNINVTAPSNTEVIDVVGNFTAKCSGKQVVAPLNGWITINNITTGEATNLYVKNGEIDNGNNTTSGSIKMVVGNQYKIKTNNNGSSYETGIFTVAKSNFTIPVNGTSLIASASYEGGKIIITADVVINCN